MNINSVNQQSFGISPFGINKFSFLFRSADKTIPLVDDSAILLKPVAFKRLTPVSDTADICLKHGQYNDRAFKKNHPFFYFLAHLFD